MRQPRAKRGVSEENAVRMIKKRDAEWLIESLFAWHWH
jgi:hypothetical protein